MRISKAVITAAGQDQNHLPLQRLVDRNGHDKSALELIVEEAASTGDKDFSHVEFSRPEDRENSIICHLTHYTLVY